MPPSNRGIPELEKALPGQRREWAFHRIGWAALALFLLAAFAGLLGPGGLWRERVERGRLAVEYDRIGRRAAELPLDIAWFPEAPGDSAVLSLSEGCLADADLDQVTPDPASVTASERGGAGFAFLRDPGARELRLRIVLKPRRPGGRDCRIGAEGGDTAAFRQWILP